MSGPTPGGRSDAVLGDGACLATWTVPGDPAQPPVVLLHGGPGLWDYLEPLGALLAGRGTVHRYDQRGCGHSSVSDSLTMERYVADLEELRVTFGHERWVVIGHSFGATLALAYAGTHPERVSGLGYLSGVGIGDWRSPYREERRRRMAPWAERFEELRGRERDRDEEVEWRRIQWATDHADPERGWELAASMAETDLPINAAANHALGGFRDIDQITWVSAVRCPVTFVHGTRDPRPVHTVRALAAHASRARKRVVSDAGHLPWLEQPEQVREILHEIVVNAASG